MAVLDVTEGGLDSTGQSARSATAGEVTQICSTAFAAARATRAVEWQVADFGDERCEGIEIDRLGVRSGAFALGLVEKCTSWRPSTNRCHDVASSAVAHVLRDVVESDLDAFYEHQREPEATEMALFPARDREAFDAHWERILANDSLIKKTIVHDGEVAGNIGCWEQDGRRLLGYWLGKEYWGRGLATCALAEFVEHLPRPLHAWVAGSNVGSIRVLEKCGFVAVGSRTEHNENSGRPVEEVLYELA